MRIKLHDRVPKPSIQGGPPCNLCIRTERIRYIINRFQMYLEKLGTDREKKIFLRKHSKEIYLQIKQEWDAMKPKEREKWLSTSKRRKIAHPIKNMMRYRLRNAWRAERTRLARETLMAKRIELLKKTLGRALKRHPKCASCQICFGEQHLEPKGYPSPVGDLCAYCHGLYKKHGLEYIKRKSVKIDREQVEDIEDVRDTAEA